MNKKILICEDEKGVQDLWKNKLIGKKYDIFSAVDGKEAVDKAKIIRPDLIVLDIRMPKLNGLEAAKQIRKLRINSKIIFVTGFQSPELSKEAKKYGIYDYITKNSPTEDIIKAIDNALKAL